MSYIRSLFLAPFVRFLLYLRCDSDDLPGFRIPQGFPEGTSGLRFESHIKFEPHIFLVVTINVTIDVTMNVL